MNVLDNPYPTFPAILLLIAIGYGTLSKLTSRPHPPGPPSFPLLGNILSLPIKSAWIKLNVWKKRYGDLVYLHGLGQHILILNSQAVIADLLEQRASIYSHRPSMIVAGELMGLGASMPLLHYGPEWRYQRKLASHALSPSPVLKYQPIQCDLAALLCQDIMEQPESFFDHVRLIAGRIVLMITYGITVDEADSKYITQAEATMEVIGRFTVPGAYLVEFLPFLRHLPKSTPFIKFHEDGERGGEMLRKLINDPFQHVAEEMRKGTATQSFTRDMLLKESIEGGKKEGYVEIGNYVVDADVVERIKWTSGSMYGAGGESTYATVLTFILAMANNPAVQKRVQQEMDTVLLQDNVTFPTFEHRENLPYLDAVIKETMRWHPALPLSIARRTAVGDWYKGCYIPAGTIVIPNVWGIAMDTGSASKYPADKFIPDRFLDPETKFSVPDPRAYAFGFGRRVCPGQRLGENSIYIIIASLVSCFDFRLPLDEDGNEVSSEMSFTENLVSYPNRFPCRITLRDPSGRDIIRERVRNSMN